MRVRLLIGAAALLIGGAALAEEPRYEAELVFPLHPQHNHAPGIVEFDGGDLLVSWYRGSGERSADDVAVYGARRASGQRQWSESFLMADIPGFPDGNTCMMIDRKDRLWLFWPTILANTWESCLTRYRVTDNYQGDGAPKWQWQGSIFLKPKRFQEKMLTELQRRVAEKDPLGEREQRLVDFVRKTVPKKLAGRLGWQPRCQPLVLPSGRILLPLYTDTFSVSVMAISDDDGQSWFASEPLVGYGNIQPALLRRDDGTLVAYMRENGPVDRIRVCESPDDGVTWGPVGATDFPNPGSGLDGTRLVNGHWLLVYNDTTQGRNRLAVSLSADEGKTWPWKRHLEHHATGAYHYPAVTQGADGTIHFVYSYFVTGGKSMKHAAVNEEWIQAGGD